MQENVVICLLIGSCRFSRGYEYNPSWIIEFKTLLTRHNTTHNHRINKQFVTSLVPKVQHSKDNTYQGFSPKFYPQTNSHNIPTGILFTQHKLAKLKTITCDLIKQNGSNYNPSLKMVYMVVRPHITLHKRLQHVL